LAPLKAYRIPGFRIALVREDGVNLSERPQIRVPAEAARVIKEYIGDSDREQFVLAMLTVRHRVIGLHTVSVGCLTSSVVHPREVFKPAILAAAAAIVLGHNHPSGDPEPSAEDVAITRRLSSAGALLGIEVLDHVIVGEIRHVSLKDRGVL
jgi:DNA repair protein RadC